MKKAVLIVFLSTLWTTAGPSPLFASEGIQLPGGGLAITSDCEKSTEKCTSPEGQFQRGSNYYFGTNGFEQNYERAARLFKNAALQGHAKSQYVLGLMYSSGNGVPQDYVEAARWYLQSARQGNQDAHFNLGTLYLFGKGVNKSLVKADIHYRLARTTGNEPMRSLIARKVLEAFLSASELEEAVHGVDKWPDIQ